MGGRVPLFLRVLRAELLELAEDIALFEARLRERFEADEISSYVYRENDALLVREQEACRAIADFVDGMDERLYKDLDEAARAVETAAADLVFRREGPKSVNVLLRRKLAKVRRYIESGDAC